MLLLLLQVVAVIPLVVACSQKKKKTEGKIGPVVALNKNTDKVKWTDKEIISELQSLNKNYRVHRCKFTDECQPCNDYVTGVETLWRLHCSELAGGIGSASDNAKARIQSAHLEVGKTFDQCAGKWGKRQPPVEKTQQSESQKSKKKKPQRQMTSKKELAVEKTQQSSKKHQPKSEQKMEPKKADEPTTQQTEGQYEELCKPAEIFTNETLDSTSL